MSLTSANTGAVQVCQSLGNGISDVIGVGSVSSPPWKSKGNEIGWTYNPGGTNMSVSCSSGGPNCYASLPRFYIADLGPSATGSCRHVYEISAWAYGVNNSTVAVIRSTYEILYNPCTPTT
jgi:Tfp pilus assembly protein PilX